MEHHVDNAAIAIARSQHPRFSDISVLQVQDFGREKSGTVDDMVAGIFRHVRRNAFFSNLPDSVNCLSGVGF